jgi:hypothetical protein
MNETVQIWLEKLGNPTAEKIKIEIEEVKGTISNEKLWALTNDIHYENIEVLEEYLEVLKEMLDDYEYTPSSTNGDYSPSNPWDAPGMSIRDFI